MPASFPYVAKEKPSCGLYVRALNKEVPAMRAAKMTERPSFQLMVQTDVQSIYHMQMPRWLFSDPRYCEMSLDAKVTYTFLYSGISNSSFALCIQMLPSPREWAASIIFPITRLPSYTRFAQFLSANTTRMTGAP
mgnify:CR=1 FL=1